MAISTHHNHRKKSRRKHRAVSEINVTPFVDVLLVLLIIFMVAAPMMTGSVDVSLPDGSGDPIKENSIPISVTIKADGTIILNNEVTPITSLVSNLQRLSDNHLDKKIHIAADKKLDYGKVMEVVKTIGGAGFTQVILVTDLSQ